MTLTPWQNFYEILGSAAGALVGLQFVSMVLIADISFRPDEEVSAVEQTSAAYATPAVVHFTFVLLLAAAMVMPWPTHPASAEEPSTLAAAILGILGLGYMLTVILRMVKQTTYRPAWEDWLFRTALPTLAFLGLTLAGTLHPLTAHPTRALFGIAFSALLLLVMAIHNAWDNVLYIVTMKCARTTTLSSPKAKLPRPTPWKTARYRTRPQCIFTLHP